MDSLQRLWRCFQVVHFFSNLFHILHEERKVKTPFNALFHILSCMFILIIHYLYIAYRLTKKNYCLAQNVFNLQIYETQTYRMFLFLCI